MTNAQRPPGLTSMTRVVRVKPRGPYQRAMCSRSVHILHTSARGARKTRVAVISRSTVVSTASLLVMSMLLLLALKLLEVIVQAVEALVPEAPVVIEPPGRVPERTRPEPAGPVLGVAAPRDEPRALEHLEVLRDGGEAHLERRGQLGDRSLALGEAGEDGAPRGVR